MALGLLINHWQPDSWYDKLGKALGKDQVYLYPDQPVDKEIHFLACWKPQAGQLSHYPSLQVIQSLGAGVDHIFCLDDVPRDVPIPHFGIVLGWDDWEHLAERLKENQVKFLIEPCIRFQGQAGEQATMFFKDPSGKCIGIQGV